MTLGYAISFSIPHKNCNFFFIFCNRFVTKCLDHLRFLSLLRWNIFKEPDLSLSLSFSIYTFCYFCFFFFSFSFSFWYTWCINTLLSSTSRELHYTELGYFFLFTLLSCNFNKLLHAISNLWPTFICYIYTDTHQNSVFS